MTVSCPPKLLIHLSTLLFKKRQDVEAAQDDSAGAPQPGSENLSFASQAQTLRAIMSVLKVHQSYLRSKNINNMRHIPTCVGRNELVKRFRAKYEATEKQRGVQAQDRAKWVNK